MRPGNIKFMLRLQEKYKKEVVPEMQNKFGHKNVMAVPKIKKVVINTGFGRLIGGKTKEEQKKAYEFILSDLTILAGRQPVLTKAKKSIASFKVREGMPVGAAVTLRGRKMYDFLERLIHIALPRCRDFQGIDQKSIDKEGNLTIGIKEHIVFPEISPEQVRNILGLEITVTTTAKTKEEGLELLRLMGFPIKT